MLPELNPVAKLVGHGLGVLLHIRQGIQGRILGQNAVAEIQLQLLIQFDVHVVGFVVLGPVRPLGQLQGDAVAGEAVVGLAAAQLAIDGGVLAEGLQDAGEDLAAPVHPLLVARVAVQREGIDALVYLRGQGDVNRGEAGIRHGERGHPAAAEDLELLLADADVIHRLRVFDVVIQEAVGGVGAQVVADKDIGEEVLAAPADLPGILLGILAGI